MQRRIAGILSRGHSFAGDSPAPSSGPAPRLQDAGKSHGRASGGGSAEMRKLEKEDFPINFKYLNHS